MLGEKDYIAVRGKDTLRRSLVLDLLKRDDVGVECGDRRLQPCIILICAGPAAANRSRPPNAPGSNRRCVEWGLAAFVLLPTLPTGSRSKSTAARPTCASFRSLAWSWSAQFIGRLRETGATFEGSAQIYRSINRSWSVVGGATPLVLMADRAKAHLSQRSEARALLPGRRCGRARLGVSAQRNRKVTCLIERQ